MVKRNQGLSESDIEVANAFFNDVILQTNLLKKYIKYKNKKTHSGKYQCVNFAIQDNDWNLYRVSVFPKLKEVQYVLLKEHCDEPRFKKLISNDTFIDAIVDSSQQKARVKDVYGIFCSYDDAPYVADVISNLMDDKSGKYYAKNKQHLIQFGTDKDTESDITEIINSNDNPTNKQRLITARLGQGDYRNELLEVWGGCCSVTGCSTKELLIASHIKPWRSSNDFQRLHKYNGLLLIATLDKAFDSGLISFSDDGSILISSKFDKYHEAGVHTDMRIELKPKNLRYLAYHREHVYRG